MRLVIEATPLLGRWSLSDVWRRDRAAWPPSPDTLFSALVAAAAGAGWGEATPPATVTASRHGQALGWLETLGAPEIEAIEAPGRSEGLTWFVPVGDDAGLDQTRSRKARRHNSVGADAAVRWAWRVDPDKAERHLPGLAEIARNVTCIGSSRGPVLALAKLLQEAAAWRPSLVPAPEGSLRLRVIHPGRLTDLERWFQAGQRPQPGPTQAYARPEEVTREPAWGDLLVLRRQAGLGLGIGRSVDIAEAARNALLAHLGSNAPELLTGHAGQGEALRRDHLAIVPLARLGDPHADGTVLGIGFVLPRGAEDAIWLALVAAVGRWLGSGGRLVIGGTTVWTLGLAADDHRVSLSPDRFRRRAQVWASATPVVLDRHPKTYGSRTLPAVVAEMCRRSGLPAPVRIRAARDPLVAGAAASRAYGLGTRAYLAGRYVTHLEIAWERPVPGPILLGAGRHFGLGLLLPRPDRPDPGAAA
jgi:CRISPR-associated protein Csb2